MQGGQMKVQCQDQIVESFLNYNEYN